MTSTFHCDLIAWGEVVRLTRELAYHLLERGPRPDLVIAIGRGGYVPGRLLADYLHLRRLTSFRVEHYGAGADRQAAAQVVTRLDVELHGLAVLVADDVNDTGESLEAAVEYIRSLGAARVTTAVLHEKAGSRFHVDVAARHLTEWRWIIYPWAVIEDVTAFVDRLEPAPRTPEEAQDHLAEIYGMRVRRRTLEDVFRLRR